MPDTAPDPSVVGDYARAALQNSLDLANDAGLLISTGRWPSGCSLAVLAAEEAAKVIVCAILPVLPPDGGLAFFAYPFSEMNRAHEMKLGMANVVTHMIAYFLRGVGAPDRGVIAETDVRKLIKEDNERKLRGFYVGYHDGKVLRPADVDEQEAKQALTRARNLAAVAASIYEWSADLPEEIAARRDEMWVRQVEAYQRGGYDAMVELAEGDLNLWNLSEEARAEIRDGLRGLVGPPDTVE